MNASIISFLKNTLMTAMMLACSLSLFAAPFQPVQGKAATTQGAKSQANPQAQAKSGTAININTASAQQLTELPRVGPKIAERIVAFRQQHGGFKKLEDLMNVKGIGEKTFAQLRSRIRL